MYREKLRQLIKEYEREIIDLKGDLSPNTPNQIIIAKNGNHYKWIQSNKGKRTIIKRNNRPYAEKLAYQKYIRQRISDLEEEVHWIQRYLHHPSPDQAKAKKMLENPGYYELLCNQLFLENSFAKKWAAESFVSSQYHPEKLTLNCLSGDIVRSKSERLIANTLFHHGIPFRYECQLTLDDATFYPDFTILHPRTNELVYWEHMGVMDNREYVHHASRKIEFYCANKIYPDINLILTYETQNQPLDASVVHEKINRFLL